MGRRRDKRKVESRIVPPAIPVFSRKDSKRDLRLDSLRGIMLVLMTLVHFSSYITPIARQSLGYVSAAEGFFFLSAYLFSFVHAGKAENFGNLIGIGLRRTLLIYRYHVLIVVTQFLVLSLYWVMFAPEQVQLANLSQQVLSGAMRELFFIHQPRLINILPMYCFFIFFSPWILFAFCRGRAVWVLAVSAGLWVIGQYKNPLIWLAAQFPGSESGYFNWIAFQVVWIGGMYIGYLSHTGKDFSFVRNRFFIGIVFLSAAVLFLSRHGWLTLWFEVQQATDRSDFGCLRLVNFSLIVALISFILHYIPKHRGLPFVSFIGRYSLQVFTFHIFLFFLLMPLREAIAEPARQHFHALLAIAVVLSLYFPALLQSRRKAGRRLAKNAKSGGKSAQSGQAMH